MTACPPRGPRCGFRSGSPASKRPTPGRGRASVPRPERLEASVETLDGVGPTIARRLKRIGLETVGDLLWQRPRRYEAARAREADQRALRRRGGGRRSRRCARSSSRRRGRLKILTARVADDTGEIKATWFNQPWLESKLTPGTRVRLRGRANRFGFAVSSYDLEGEVETADFAPVYPAGEDVAQKKLRELRAQALALVRDAGEPLPAALRAERGAPAARRRARRAAPPARARRGRAGQAAARLRRASRPPARARADGSAPRAGVRAGARRAGRAARALPRVAPVHAHPATRSGRSARSTATSRRTTPMQRLLQGDVGSGKTVVALYALLRAVEAGRQGALMAPTETLAEQHFLTIDELCQPLGVRVSLLTSSIRAREHAAARQLIASGDAHVVVGTHALIQEEVDFHDLAVAVVDEQHRFGVEPAERARRGPQPARPPPDRDADPADARADGLRRPRRQRALASTRRPEADRHRAGSPRTAAPRRTRDSGGTSTTAGRRTSSAR